MDKDEMKNKISMALKDPILQQGFEIICKKLAELEKENAELNNFIMQSKKDGISPINALIIKNLGNQLAKAKELLKWFVWYFREGSPNLVPYKHKVAEAEQFLKDSEE